MLDASHLLDHYNCFQFSSDKVDFLDLGLSSLLIKSDQEELLIKNYYDYTHKNWHVALKLPSKIILPDQFKQKASQAHRYTYYHPNMELKNIIYHNQPNNGTSIGVVDFSNYSITNFKLHTRKDRSLALKLTHLLSENLTGKVIFRNWGTTPHSRKLLFAFNDTMLAHCSLGCTPSGFIKEFKSNKKECKKIARESQSTLSTTQSTPRTREKRSMDSIVFSKPIASSANKRSNPYASIGSYVTSWYEYITGNSQKMNQESSNEGSSAHYLLPAHLISSDNLMLYSYIASLYNKRYNTIKQPSMLTVTTNTLDRKTHQVYAALEKGQKEDWSVKA